MIFQLGSLVQTIFICICYLINLPVGIVILIAPTIIHMWNTYYEGNILYLIPFISLIPFTMSFLFDNIFIIIILPIIGVVVHLVISVLFNCIYRDPECTNKFTKQIYYNILNDFSLLIALSCPILKYYMVAFEFFLIPTVLSILYAFVMLYLMYSRTEYCKWGVYLTNNEEQQNLFGINDC